MRRSSIFVVSALLGFGCSGGEDPPIVDLVVDSNRSGLLEPGDPSEDDEDIWDAQRGAVVLANLDDDDGDGIADAMDDVVNGPADVQDLSSLVIRAWPTAPSTATARLVVGARAAANVRVFRVIGDEASPASYRALADATAIALTPAELVAGARFAIEARDFVSSTAADAWDGMIDVTLRVEDPTLPAPLTDTAKLRVAPLLFQYNTAPTQAVYYTDLGDYTRSLLDGMKPAMALASVPVNGIDLDALGLDGDQWTQDFFDIAYTSRPGPGGKAIGMTIAIRSAQPERDAGAVARRYFLGPDFGMVFRYAKDGGGANDHGHSMNSFGNWDVIPPHTKGAESYPLGRNLWGSAPDGEHPDDTFADFVRAQRVQPAINIDTSWLTVGHVDEFTSWVKTNTPRGWGMLIASPKRARQMLMDLQAQGHGQERMFAGKDDGGGDTAGYTIDQVLASMKLAAANQKAQLKIDAQAEILRNEIGLDAAEVTEVPFLFENTFGGMLAFQPGTVNLLHVDGRVVIPDPFGPIIDGVDPFKADLQARLGALGLDVHFADDWDMYHLQAGEVHCGTNVSRDLAVAWWSSGR